MSEKVEIDSFICLGNDLTEVRNSLELLAEERMIIACNGVGSYGRPKTALPKDFEIRIKACLSKIQKLSDYCDELQMKRSTFYKYAKQIENKLDSLDNSICRN